MVSVVCVLPELNKKFLKIVPIQGSRNSDLIYRSSAQPRAWHPQALTQVHPPYPHWQNSPESYDPNLLVPLLISTTTGSRPGLHASSQGLQSLPSHRSWRRHVCRFLGVLGTALHPRASEQLGAAALQVTLPKHRSQENVLCSVMICHLTWHQSASQTHFQQPPALEKGVPKVIRNWTSYSYSLEPCHIWWIGTGWCPLGLCQTSIQRRLKYVGV